MPNKKKMLKKGIGKFGVIWKGVGKDGEDVLLWCFDTTIECNAYIHGIISSIKWFTGDPEKFPGEESLRREFIIRDISRIDDKILSQVLENNKK